MNEAHYVFTSSDRHAAQVLRALERARGNLAAPDLLTLRATVESGGGKSSTAQARDGSSGRIRTYDPPVNSRMLYR